MLSLRFFNRLARIPASSIFLSVFGMFATRLQSFNELELQFQIPRRWEPFVGARLPSADTLGYSLKGFDLNPPRDFLAQIAHQAKRKKALKRLKKDSLNPYTMAALGRLQFTNITQSQFTELKRDLLSLELFQGHASNAAILSAA